MFEKRWPVISPQAFTVDGTTSGIVTIAATTDCFKVKQKIRIKSTAEPTLNLQVNEVLSDTQIRVGPLNKSILCSEDISVYLVADSAIVEAPEQARVSIPATEHERAVYEEEPTVAKRTILVDKFGNLITDTNPLPVDATIMVGNIDIRRLTHEDDDPTLGDIHDSIRIGDGTNLQQVTTQLDARTVDTLHSGATSTVITVDDTPVEVKVSASAKAGRKTVFIQPRKKGLFWGFNSDVDRTDGVKGGAPLGKNQPAEFHLEANTPLYLVGPASGVKIFIGEA